MNSIVTARRPDQNISPARRLMFALLVAAVATSSGGCSLFYQESVRSAGTYCSTSHGWYLTDTAVGVGAGVASLVYTNEPVTLVPAGLMLTAATIGVLKRQQCARYRKTATPEMRARDKARLEEKREQRAAERREAEEERKRRVAAAKRAAASVEAQHRQQQQEQLERQRQSEEERQRQDAEPTQRRRGQHRASRPSREPARGAARGRDDAGRGVTVDHSKKVMSRLGCSSLASVDERRQCTGCFDNKDAVSFESRNGRTQCERRPGSRTNEYSREGMIPMTSEMDCAAIDELSLVGVDSGELQSRCRRCISQRKNLMVWRGGGNRYRDDTCED